MKLPRHTRRGAGILTVLLASTMLLMLAFTVAATSFHHLSLSNRMSHAQNARNLAEAALAKGLAQLLENPDRYKNPNAGTNDDVFAPNASAPENQRGLLTFSPGRLAFLNSTLKNKTLVASINNLHSDADIQVDGRTLTGESAYLRAVGVDHGIEKTIECVIYIPRFPWSMASAGPIVGEKLYVAAVDNLDLADDKNQHKPGHLVTNAPDLNDAVKFTGNEVTITGDLQSAGGANLGDAVVRGERRLFAKPADLPLMDLSLYSTATSARGANVFNTGTGPDTEIKGPAYRNGSLTFNNGLHLNGGILYVTQDLTVHGGITGEGAIVVRGNATINGGGSLTTTNKVAILSNGDMTLTGGSERLKVKGMLYSEGKLELNRATVHGAALSSDRNGSGNSKMVLTDTNLVSQAGGDPLEISIQGQAGTQFGSGDHGNAGLNVGAGSLAFSNVTAVHYPTPTSFGDETELGLDIKVQMKQDVDMTRFLHSDGKSYVGRQLPANTALDVDGNFMGAGGVYVTKMTTDGKYYDELTPLATPESVLQPTDVQYVIAGQVFDYGDPAAEAAAIAEADRKFKAKHGRDPNSDEIPTLHTNVRNYLLDHFWMYASRGISHAVYEAGGGGPGTKLTFDLNEFLNKQERIRVLYWRELP